VCAEKHSLQKPEKMDNVGTEATIEQMQDETPMGPIPGRPAAKPLTPSAESI
jgi:hypothetical protein